MESEIAAYFANRSILLTGSTGFLGKATLEKLLRSCPKLHCIFVLLRPKKGLDVKTRLSELLQDTVFDTLRSNHPNAFSKVRAIAGDVLHPDLIFKESDRKLLQDEVSVVMHLAAIVKFDEEISKVVDNNVGGVEKIIELCKEIKNLQAFLHVSTAYSNSDREEIHEIIYPLETTESVDEIKRSEDTYEKPNNYMFAKALAEQVLNDEAKNLPICIVRPSIITGAWREPVPGWVSGYNGPVGVFIAIGKGAVRSLLLKKDKIVDFIPVDMCANIIIAAAYQRAQDKKSELTIYNCCSGQLNPVAWETVHNNLKKLIHKHPIKNSIRSPGYSPTSSPRMHRTREILLERIPANAFDFVSFLKGKKEQSSGMKTYQLVKKAKKLTEVVTTNDWKFMTSNMEALFHQLSQRDKKIFNFNVKEIKWPMYLEDYWLGIQRFVLKDSKEPQSNKDETEQSDKSKVSELKV